MSLIWDGIGAVASAASAGHDDVVKSCLDKRSGNQLIIGKALDDTERDDGSISFTLPYGEIRHRIAHIND
jgi:hypothetical protein